MHTAVARAKAKSIKSHLDEVDRAAPQNAPEITLLQGASDIPHTKLPCSAIILQITAEPITPTLLKYLFPLLAILYFLLRQLLCGQSGLLYACYLHRTFHSPLSSAETLNALGDISSSSPHMPPCNPLPRQGHPFF